MRTNNTGSGAQREPMPGGNEQRHGERVSAHIAAEIDAAGGWLSFEQFMELALYAPGLGYYSAGARKFGPSGDFVTAPEISPLFGACVARQCAEVLAGLRRGEILEIGAGTGRLAGDILARLEQLGALPPRYSILEISADLRERQHRHLSDVVPHLVDRVVWLDEPPAREFDGLIVANEVLDALPVRRFRWTRAQTEELGVARHDGRFVWASRPAADGFAQYCGALHAVGGAWDEGYSSEFCPRLGAWTASMTRSLRAGAVLWFDYGLPRSQYYFPERSSGTLLCHYRQRAHDDPLQRPGLQDITAWVDFSALAAAASAAGFRLAGFTTQTYFLAGNGIDVEMQRIAAGDPNRFAQLANQARQLLMPGEMGERFKAMAWMRGVELPLAGFALRDFSGSL
ncbi:MAG: class I SAM-dependent methyltransferase [Steroidobacterales bacterium]